MSQSADRLLDDDNPGEDDGDPNWHLPAAVNVEIECEDTPIIGNHMLSSDSGGGALRQRLYVKPGTHKTMALNSTNNGFGCKECGKIYKHKISLQTHERMHSGIKPYLCQECGRGFARKDILSKHERSHTVQIMEAARKEVQLEEAISVVTETVFTCLECGKSYDKRSSLAAHEKLHSSTRSYFS